MEFATLLQTIQQQLGEFIPSLIGALLILAVGWIAAMVVRALIRRLLGVLELNRRASSGAEKGIDFEGGISKGAYYLILLLALVAFFDVLDLEIVSAPLQNLVDKFFAYAPNLVAGVAITLVAWLIATLVKTLSVRALGATSIDEKLADQAGMTAPSKRLGDVLYWIVILLFLPAILGAFQVSGLLDPVEGMIKKSLAMIPNIVAAAVIGFAGWLVAKIVRDVVTNLLSAAGADRLGERAGLSDTLRISHLAGLVVFVLVLLPVLTAALNALQIEAVTAPATQMLSAVTTALPNIFAAALILVIAYLVSRFVAGLVGELLASAGFDRLPETIGLQGAFQGGLTLSAMASRAIVFFTMLFATVEAAGRLGFSQVSDLVSTFIQFASQVLLGTAIIAVGFWLSNLAHTTVTRIYGSQSSAPAGVVRFAILGLVLAMGLRSMGLADDIVNMAFGLTLGSVAVAAALAFGLGGREAAGKQLESWLNKLNKQV